MHVEAQMSLRSTTVFCFKHFIFLGRYQIFKMANFSLVSSGDIK